MSGTGLSVGDVVVFDGIVINLAGSSSDAWGAVELNQGGYAGVYAAVGVLVETGTNSGNSCQVFTNGTSVHAGVSQGYRTNRVRIELTCTRPGSTTNMSYAVKIDQGISGNFNAVTSGINFTFANNTIALTFGANNATHQFIQTQPLIAIGAPAPGSITLAQGLPAAFAVAFTQGFPLNTAQHWLSNGVPIPNATNLIYTTPPVSASYNGTQYSVVVTNLFTFGNVVTSPPVTLTVRSVPGPVPFLFNVTTISNTSQAYPLSPPAAISGSSLLVGDTVFFDGVIVTNSALTGSGDGWCAVNFNPAGSPEGVTGATLGVLARLGVGPSQLFTNGVGNAANNPTSSGAPVNRLRVEFYPSATGSTTNMGWKVAVDQNLTGTFLPAVTGTNLTFPSNTIPLGFGAYSVGATVSPWPFGLENIQQQLSTTNQVIGGFDQVAVFATYSNYSSLRLSSTNPGLVYASSDTNVVTVSSSGFLQAVGAGQATVTSSLSNLVSSTAVTVVNPGPLISINLVLSQQMPLYSNQQAVVLGAFANATNVNLLNYRDSSFIVNNPNVVSVSASGLITGIAPGTATIIASNNGVASAPQSVAVSYPTNRFIFDSFGDGFWTIINQANSNALAATPTGASQGVAGNTNFNQQFELLLNYSNSTFRIRTRSTWQCLAALVGAAPGSGVVPISYNGAAVQQWYLVDAGNGWFRIVNAANDLVMQTDNQNPATITVANASSSPRQLWSFSYVAPYPKKGMVGFEGDYHQYGFSWAYNYDDGTGTHLPPFVDFVPMMYANQYWESLGSAQALAPGWLQEGQPDYLLCYNEPDNATQANTSVSQVLSLWPQIQALNVPLVSPAVQTTFGTWEYDFFNQIASNGYRVDYTAVHEYVPPNAASLISQLRSVYNTWGRPVWLTEFSPVDWSSCGCWSENDDYNFLAEFMWQAEGQPWLKRYSVFAFGGTNSAAPWVNNGFTGSMFLDSGVNLSPYGELYAAWDEDLALHPRTPYILHNLATSFRLTATNSSSLPLASDIYIRNATTEWALLPAPATGHWYIISLFDGRRLRDNNGTLDLAPYGTTNAAVDWWFNGPDASGYYYLDNLAAAQSLQSAGSAPGITFGLINDPAPSTATQWRLIKPYQPVAIIPAAPPNLAVSYSSQSAALNWSGSGFYYNVYRGTASGGPYTKIASLTANNNIVDNSVQNGAASYYVVTALDILGVESTNSNEVVARPASTNSFQFGVAQSGDGLQFNWPSDHTGWRLLVNTNNLADPNAWTPIPNSEATNSYWSPFAPSQSNAFYRLVYP
jgi:hypothetical protein